MRRYNGVPRPPQLPLGSVRYNPTASLPLPISPTVGLPRPAHQRPWTPTPKLPFTQRYPVST